MVQTRFLVRQIGFLQISLFFAYAAAAYEADDQLPSHYVTDGQMYLDSRNPDRLEENRRTTQFMCSTDFATFFAAELVPTISREQPVSQSRDDRVILGLSFGGLNSACFGLMLPNLFAGVAMQSPASGDHLDIVRESYEKMEALPLKMFPSVGTKNDNLAAAG